MERPLAERSAAISDCGRRTLNEDAVLVAGLSGDRELVAVADGMGGLSAGDVASQCALDALQAALSDGAELRDAVAAANAAVLDEAGRRGGQGGMGTTLVALLRSGSSYCIANVGDSRAYRVDRDGVMQLTQDHSFVAEAVQAGRMSLEEASRSRWRNAVTRAVGTEPVVEADCIGPFDTGEPHMVVLCTDGLHRVLSDEQLRRTVLAAADPIAAADSLTRAALEAGTDDNVSVAMIVFDGAGADGRGAVPAGNGNGRGARGGWDAPLAAHPGVAAWPDPAPRPVPPSSRWTPLQLLLILTGLVALTVYVVMLKALV